MALLARALLALPACLAVLFAVSSAAVVPEENCDAKPNITFACSNGNCILSSDKCDGMNDCLDNSDEADAMCAKIHPLVIPVGRRAEVAVQYAEAHKAVMFLMCHDTGCSTLAVRGTYTNGSLAYIAWTDSNARGGGGAVHDVRLPFPPASPGDIQLLTPGLLTFVAERRPAELAVWPLGKPEHAVTVPIDSRSDSLRVRPHYWTTDMPVAFVAGDPPRV